MRSKGLSYAAIGRIVGLSRQRVHQLTSGYHPPRNKNGGSWLAELRNAVLSRDTNKCQLCYSGEDLILHHIDLNDRNNNTTNLITLCHGCHARYHKTKREKPIFKVEETEVLQLWQKPYREARDSSEGQRLWREVLETEGMFGRNSAMTKQAFADYMSYARNFVEEIYKVKEAQNG